MPARDLPNNPNLEHLKHQAKTLQETVRSGDAEAAGLVREFHPRLTDIPDGAAALTAFALADAQLVVARRYGFASWPRLREHIDTVTRYTRSPHHQPIGGPITTASELADEFLRLACLTYGGDDLTRHQRARDLLTAHPELAAASIYTAAAVGDTAAASILLAADASLANREGGPHRWPPLLYLAYSRVDSTRPGHSTVDVARLLLGHGADPNAGYLWEGLTSPFTALTGAFGEGEDAVNQPRHQHSHTLARMLLDADADPNDSQTLYNRQFNPDNDHLELLFAHGLGRGSGGPWHARLGPAHPTPAQMLADQLLWAVQQNLPERVRLLLHHGVDITATCTFPHPAIGDRTAHELAVLLGNTEIADLLAAAGAAPVPLNPMEAFVAACMRADHNTVQRLTGEDPTLARRVIATLPELIIRAAELNRPDTVRLMTAVGFDVNTRRRVTPLHTAAHDGHLDLARVLIELGADPTIRDTEFNSTPLGWAQHGHQHDVAAYLSGLGNGPATSDKGAS
ncbi:ankyrin repeat domain-containing protein [Virgisporangium aurantiacum]|uniref:Ankyrin repeat-containing protein n=1 Tax=Virgisporangium aurantiacum TaxID=175570 RepID=A0A8J3ZKC4_9ACTN|nr:ankyrin repeat domain-containing protein [Virgisporangium aurantiacum]GIJ64398.1 hypothetical protein Vau01_119140 [Virgisporangium aurantiacum]